MTSFVHSGNTKGYILGKPMPYRPSSVRSLTPVAAMVMRVLMHAVLLWTTCNKDDVSIIILSTYNLLMHYVENQRDSKLHSA